MRFEGISSPFSRIKIKTTSSSQMSFNFEMNTWCYRPEDRNIDKHEYENVQFCIHFNNILLPQKILREFAFVRIVPLYFS
jgi:hypothetical protein